MMPVQHAAMPHLCACVGWQADGRGAGHGLAMDGGVEQLYGGPHRPGQQALKDAGHAFQRLLIVVTHRGACLRLRGLPQITHRAVLQQ